MFDWFKKKQPSNVVQFPGREPGASSAPPAPPRPATPKMPEVNPPPVPEKDPVTYYRLGLTDNNRVSFSMGYSEITMSAEGINNMIEQLELFRDQLQEEGQ